MKKIVGIVKLIKVMRANRVAWSNFPFRKAKFRMKLFSKTNERENSLKKGNNLSAQNKPKASSGTAKAIW